MPLLIISLFELWAQDGVSINQESTDAIEKSKLIFKLMLIMNRQEYNSQAIYNENQTPQE